MLSAPELNLVWLPGVVVRSRRHEHQHQHQHQHQLRQHLGQQQARRHQQRAADLDLIDYPYVVYWRAHDHHAPIYPLVMETRSVFDCCGSVLWCDSVMRGFSAAVICCSLFWSDRFSVRSVLGDRLECVGWGFLGVGICLRGFFVEIRSLGVSVLDCAVFVSNCILFGNEVRAFPRREAVLVSECMPEYVVVTVFLPVHQLIFSVLRFFQRICANREP